jgi:hypothetical protein
MYSRRRAGRPRSIGSGGVMASRKDRADALRRFSEQIRDFHDKTLIALERLRLDLIYANLDDEDRASYSPELEQSASILTEALEVMSGSQRERIDGLAQALDAVGSEARSSLDSFPAKLPRNSPIPAAGQSMEQTGAGYTGETISHAKETFEVWSFAGFDPALIDWGDPTFPQKFNTEVWKGHTADDYRELTRQAPSLLWECRVSGTTEVRDALGTVRDAYFGMDHIHLQIGHDDKVSVANGRHRLMAAIECGLSVPVTVERAKPRETRGTK